MSRPAEDEVSRPTGGGALEPPVGEGDDDHVILWMLSLTPTQRLEAAQGFLESVRRLQHGLRS